MSEYDWHQVVPLRWSVTGTLQQLFKRRVCNSRGVWYDEFEWRDVPRQPVDDIPLIKYPAQETRVSHAVTCKMFPDPHDERDPVGPCTCGAIPPSKCPSCHSGLWYVTNGTTGAQETCKDAWHDRTSLNRGESL